MASKRMFSMDIVDSDCFLELPASAQNLYFHLGMRADDEGMLNNARRISGTCGASPEDLQLLIDEGFLIRFPTGVVAIRGWRVNNRLRADRLAASRHKAERQQLVVDECGFYDMRGEEDDGEMPDICRADGEKTAAQDRIGKNSSFCPDCGEAARDGEGRGAKKRTYERDALPYKAALTLSEYIRENFPASKPVSEAQMQTWADSFRLLHERDGYSWPVIQDVLNFSQQDDFWRSNILSGVKFRKQFLTLLAKSGVAS